jgi:hypothetical protein
MGFAIIISIISSKSYTRETITSLAITGLNNEFTETVSKPGKLKFTIEHEDYNAARAILKEQEIISIEKFHTTIQHFKDIILDLLNFAPNTIKTTIYTERISISKNKYSTLFSESGGILNENLWDQLNVLKNTIHQLQSLIDAYKNEEFVNIDDETRIQLDTIRTNLRTCQHRLRVRKNSLINAIENTL